MKDITRGNIGGHFWSTVLGVGISLLLIGSGCSLISNDKITNGSGLVGDGVPVVTSESFPLAPKAVPLDEPLGSSKGTPSELGAVWEAWALLNRDHIDKGSFQPEEFEEFAVRGLIEAVDDTQTSNVQQEVLSIAKENCWTQTRS